MNLTSHDTTLLLLSVAIMLLFSRGIGELLRKAKQPIVIGEIIAGIILGPTIFGFIFPDLFKTLFNDSQTSIVVLSGITVLAVTMLLLVSGLEVDLTLAIKQGKAASLISSMGIIFPFAVGFGAAYFFPEQLGISNISQHLIFSLFVGTALSITALPVVARTLMDLNIFRTEVGFLIITSAMLNDLVGWIIFSVILAMLGKSDQSFDLGTTIILLVSFIFFTLVIGKRIINYLLPKLEKFTTYPGGILNFVLVLGFLGAAFTEYIGVHAIFGAFIIGIAIGDSVHLKEETREIIQQFVTNIFAPLFFISIGLRIDFVANFDFQIVITFLVLAFIGKVVGGGLGAYWGGMSREDSLVIGFGMNSRGAMEIVLGMLAFKAGLIQEKVFVALVIMALVTSISSAPLMSYFLKKSKKKLNFIDLLKTDNVFFSDAKTKGEIIDQLCKHASSKNKLKYEYVLKEVTAREEQMSTGLVNHFAIPHARLKIQYPIVAMAVCKKEIEFESLDGLPVKVAVLLLTPSAEPELQLKLLADISKKFSTDKTANNITSSKTIEEIISIVKHLS